MKKKYLFNKHDSPSMSKIVRFVVIPVKTLFVSLRNNPIMLNNSKRRGKYKMQLIGDQTKSRLRIAFRTRYILLSYLYAELTFRQI